MSTSIPPYGALFLFTNETWITIGWAKTTDNGNFIWCREDEAMFVIGENVKMSARWRNNIAHIDDIGSASRTRSWKYDKHRPDFIRSQERQEANENIGKRVHIIDGKLKFD